MKIKIEYSNTQYTIDADGTCFTVIRHGFNTDKDSKNFGNPTETTFGYFSKMENAIKRIIKDGIGSRDEVASLQEYVNIIKDANAFIGAQLQEA